MIIGTAGFTAMLCVMALEDAGVRPQGEVVFKKRTSLVFKSLQVVRFYDAKRNALAYLAYSDKVVEGSPKNAISAVPVMPWRQ